jgi:hypothetical protein
MTDSYGGYTVGGSYAMSLLNEWLEVKKLAEAFRDKLLAGASDDIETKAITRRYVAKLTNFWVELEPKVTDRDEFPLELREEFSRMRDYYYNPAKLLSKENADDIFKLEAIIRKVLEAMRVTVFEL